MVTRHCTLQRKDKHVDDHTSSGGQSGLGSDSEKSGRATISVCNSRQMLWSFCLPAELIRPQCPMRKVSKSSIYGIVCLMM